MRCPLYQKNSGRLCRAIQPTVHVQNAWPTIQSENQQRTEPPVTTGRWTCPSATTLTSPAQFYFKPLFVRTTHSTNKLQTLLDQFMAPLCWIHDPPPFTSKSFHNDLSAGTHQTYEVCIAALIPQSPQLQAQVRSESLRWCHKSGECAKSCARRSVCLWSQGGGGASIGLLT